jgi:DNA repair protein RadD
VIALRPYQQRAVEETRAAFGGGAQRVLLVAPTGAGKTVIAANVVELALAIRATSVVFFIAGRVELLDQTVAKLAHAGVTDTRVIQAERDDGNPDARVIVASVPTLAARLAGPDREQWLAVLGRASLVIVDECHHMLARTWLEVAHAFPPIARILGLSATPQRSDRRGLSDMFDTLVIVARVSDLVREGFLAPSRVFAPDRVLAPRELALDPVDAFERYALEPRTERAIVFAQTRAHASAIARSFQERGYASDSVDGLTRDRKGVLERFARSEIQVLASVSVLVEGFDDPGVSVAILARRFTHVGAYIQAGGRVLRPHPEKPRATIADLCGSALVHGPLDIDRDFSLSGTGIVRTSDTVRRCPGCAGVYLASARTSCPFCGAALPTISRAKPKSLAEQLHEVTKDYEPREWNVRHARDPRRCGGCKGSIQAREKYVYVKGGESMHPRCVFTQAEKRRASDHTEAA